MKRILVAACAAAMLFSINANAQGIVKKVVPTLTLGLKVGANMQQMSSSNSATWDNTFKPGILGGAFVSVHKNKIGVRVEGLIKTASFDVYNSAVKVNTLSLDIPALFEYKIVKRVWIQVGPQFSTLISAKQKNGPDVKGNFRTSDIAAVGGIEVTLPAKLTVGGRYIKGLTNVNNLPSTAVNASEKWNNTAIQLYVGFRFLG